MKLNVRKIVMASLLAALVCVATMILKIPSPLKGYLNLGDGIVLLAGWALSPLYGFLAAGLGSALADLFSGYLVYAPATFLIKGGMALLATVIFRFCRNRLGDFWGRLLGGISAELFMIGGYYVFEGILYGFAPALVNIPANAVQAVAGLILGMILIKTFEKNKISLS